jgi:hypothetical protein
VSFLPGDRFMQKHVLLNAMGVVALSLFCACTMMDKKEEAKPESAPVAEATQVPADVTAQAETPAAPVEASQAVAQAETPAPAQAEQAPVAAEAKA